MSDEFTDLWFLGLNDELGVFFWWLVGSMGVWLHIYMFACAMDVVCSFLIIT